jgi:hypothetical protein
MAMSNSTYIPRFSLIFLSPDLQIMDILRTKITLKSFILSSQTKEYSCQEPAFQFQLILFFLPFEIYANNNGK